MSELVKNSWKMFKKVLILLAQYIEYTDVHVVLVRALGV